MRYLPLPAADRQEMLAACGVETIRDLYSGVAASAWHEGVFNDLPLGLNEWQTELAVRQLADQNQTAGQMASFCGAGAYRHHVPAVVDHLIQRGEFLTSYTPYQPEISQGTLQYLFEFQTIVARLTGMDVANASMYDGSTACAEAVTMANRITGRNKALLSGQLHPHYAAVVQSMARWTGVELSLAKPDPLNAEDLIGQITPDLSCVVVQYPSFFGHLNDYSSLAKACQAAGVLLVVAVSEIVALGLLKSPGSMGADIVVAEGQSLGNGLNFGGPYVGLFATRSNYVRQMPGRLVGETVDANGQRGFVLTLVAREQHIRRDKATSNICTNSGLCALAFTIHVSLLGEQGLRRLAQLNHAAASDMAQHLSNKKHENNKITVCNKTYFNEFLLDLGQPAEPLVERWAARGLLAGVPLSRLYPNQPELANHLLVAATELTQQSHKDEFYQAIKEVC